MEESGCKHYQRTCEIMAPCCNIFYVCHNCHDEQYKGVKGPGCLVERLDRKQIKTIKCLKCNKEQDSNNICKYCENVFAKYYCKSCNLFENNPKKKIYHCDGCGICRIGIKEDYFHCNKCKACLNISAKANHKCNDDGLNSNCPVCLENLFYSRESSYPLSCCQNWIHVSCFRKYVKNFVNCPFCSKSIVSMPKEEIENIDKLIEETKELLPKEFKEKKVSILCNDCLKKTENIEFHPYGMKCSNCGSYNTKM